MIIKGKKGKKGKKMRMPLFPHKIANLWGEGVRRVRR
tara:strand:- start:345 stop:455 length:111 start_codon:yes stop_codon:yes gene_type:complete